jgi:hypothetical protein
MPRKPTIQRDKHEGKLSRPLRARPTGPGRSPARRGSRQKATPRSHPLRRGSKPRSMLARVPLA